MSRIESKLSAAILTKVQARRKPAPVGQDGLRFNPSSSAVSVRLREVTFSDFSGVLELKRRWALLPDSLENWEHLWSLNPALEQVRCPRPMGWILEVPGKIIGYLGNISLTYRYGEKILSAVAGHAFVVDSAYRANCLSLVEAFYSQKSVDLYLTTTAIKAVGEIALAFKCNPLPQQDYEEMLFWVLRPYWVAQITLRKIGFPQALAHVCGMLTCFAMGASKVIRTCAPRQDEEVLEVQEIKVDEIGDEFESLWREKLDESPRLLADRSPASLRWHFDIPGHMGNTCVLCCFRQTELVGYAVIRNDSNHSSGLRRSLIADLLVKQDDPEVLKTLWISAYRHAKRARSHILQILGFPMSIRQEFTGWNPYRVSGSTCPFYYKAADPCMHNTLSDERVWYATPFDGDTTLIP